MAKNKNVRSISFNITKEEDRKILEHIENINFSGYVKELILDDIARRNQPLRISTRTSKGGIKHVVMPTPLPQESVTV